MRPVVCGSAVGLLAAVSLAACGSGDSGGSSGTATSASGSGSDGDYRTRALAGGRAYAECARAHGAPGFPDPVIQDGVLAFPDITKADIEAAGSPCRDVAQRIPYPPQIERVRPSEDVYQVRLQYARCARENGLPDYPDPRRDGSDELAGTEIGRIGYLANLGISGPIPQAYIDVRNACDRVGRELQAAEQSEPNGGG